MWDLGFTNDAIRYFSKYKQKLRTCPFNRYVECLDENTCTYVCTVYVCTRSMDVHMYINISAWADFFVKAQKHNDNDNTILRFSLLSD